MTRESRAAITECVRLIELLLQSELPVAKSLGLIVVGRMAAIARDGPGAILSSRDAEMWAELAKQNDPLAPGPFLAAVKGRKV